jgi:hypothetical protein
MVVDRRRLGVVVVKAQPFHAVDDGVDVFLFFLGRVGVVETQVAAALIIARQPEVQADRLGVADVQVAVRLGRKRVMTLGMPSRTWVPAARSDSTMARRKLEGSAGAGLFLSLLICVVASKSSYW